MNKTETLDCEGFFHTEYDFLLAYFQMTRKRNRTQSRTGVALRRVKENCHFHVLEESEIFFSENLFLSFFRVFLER